VIIKYKVPAIATIIKPTIVKNILASFSINLLNFKPNLKDK
jgi:hypothetical protein